MPTTTRTEKRKRGIFGRLFLILFWLWNGLMAFWLFSAFRVTGEQLATAASEAERTGMAAGSALATGVILTVWAAGAGILGLIVLLSPGKVVITETTRD